MTIEFEKTIGHVTDAPIPVMIIERPDYACCSLNYH
jgi:hypothetical protein